MSEMETQLGDAPIRSRALAFGAHPGELQVVVGSLLVMGVEQLEQLEGRREIPEDHRQSAVEFWSRLRD
jgi:hypothetical protein